MNRISWLAIGSMMVFASLLGCTPEAGGESPAVDGAATPDVTTDAGPDLVLDSAMDPVDASGGMDATPVVDAAPDAAPVDVEVPDLAPPDMAVVDAGPPPALAWVAIPAGNFQMGCSPNDDQCSEIEIPVHAVEISAFELNPREISQREFTAYFGYNPSFYFDCDDCPVDSVTWNESRAFCEDVGARLPSEAEWEYAARAGTTTRYFCGDDPACLDDVAWYDGNAEGITHPGGTKAANAFGLYDTLGNAWEWVEDCWHDDYAMDPPLDGAAWLGEDCSYRVVRGGNWGLDGRGLRASNRDGDYPDTYLLPPPGFRCARDVEAP